MNTLTRMGGALLAVFVVACAKEAPPTQSSTSQSQLSQAPIAGGPQSSGAPMGPMGMGPMGMGPGRMGGPACAMGTGPLGAPVLAAVQRALDDERRAEAQYTASLSQLGGAPHLRQIARAEARHQAALERVLTSHGAAIPEAKKADVVTAPDLAAACRIGVDAEKKNIAMYDELLKSDLPPDVKCVFEHLRGASVERHLPAFQRCAGP